MSVTELLLRLTLTVSRSVAAVGRVGFLAGELVPQLPRALVALGGIR